MLKGHLSAEAQRFLCNEEPAPSGRSETTLADLRSAASRALVRPPGASSWGLLGGPQEASGGRKPGPRPQAQAQTQTPSPRPQA